MNPVGMSRDACLAALEHYLRDLEHLAVALSHLDEHGRDERAEELLGKLLFDVDVDVAVRAAADGRGRQSEIEAEVFEPAARQLQGRIQRLAASRASRQWLPAVNDLEGLIRDAIVVGSHRRTAAPLDA